MTEQELVAAEQQITAAGLTPVRLNYGRGLGIELPNNEVFAIYRPASRAFDMDGKPTGPSEPSVSVPVEDAIKQAHEAFRAPVRLADFATPEHWAKVCDKMMKERARFRKMMDERKRAEQSDSI